MTNKAPSAAKKPAALPAGYAGIHGGIVDLLDTARRTAARSINALMTASYWEVGRRIVEAEQQGKRRAGYGEQLIERLASDLTQRFGRGFSRQNLQQMRSFFLGWPIRQTLSGESSPASLQGRPVLAQERPWQLGELAQRFALPWSAYVRLLSDWAYPDENPPVGLILCADKGHALARYALDGVCSNLAQWHAPVRRAKDRGSQGSMPSGARRKWSGTATPATQ